LSAAGYARPPGLPLGATIGAESVAGAEVREHALPTNSMPVVAPEMPAREAAVAVAAVAGQVAPAAGEIFKSQLYGHFSDGRADF